MPLFLSDTFPKIQSLCFREHPACKPLYKYGWEPLTYNAPGSVHADYARYSRRLCRIRTASSAFFVNEKKRMGILFSRYAGGCRKRYNDTKIKRHPKNAKRVRTLIHPYYTINFRKWKVLKAQFTIRLHLDGYNSLYPFAMKILFRSFLFVLLILFPDSRTLYYPKWKPTAAPFFVKFDFYIDHIPQKFRTTPFFLCLLKENVLYHYKVYSQNKNAVRTQNNGIVECFRLSFASALFCSLFPYSSSPLFLFFYSLFLSFFYLPFLSFTMTYSTTT